LTLKYEAEILREESAVTNIEVWHHNPRIFMPEGTEKNRDIRAQDPDLKSL
jgi:hypothetical protein